MSDLEAELAAAMQARSASVMPDPDAWEKHRVAALAQPVTSRTWFSRRRVLPLAVAAAVVLVAAVGTGFVVADNGSAPASAPTPATSTTARTTSTTSGTAATVASSRAAIPAPAAVATTTVAVPALTCTGELVGSAHLTPPGVTGFSARLQLRRVAGEDLLCGGITGTAGGTVQTSTGGTVSGGGPLELAASSTWDQGSPVFVWGAVDTRVSGVHVTGAGGKTVQVQFGALAPGRRAFLAVLPANTKIATLTATGANGHAVATSHLTTTFGEPDALPTAAPSAASTASPSASSPPTSSPAMSKSPTPSSPPNRTAPSTTSSASPVTSTTSAPASPATGCDGPGNGVGIVDLGVGSGTVSFNYLANKTLCFSNGGGLTAAHRVAGVMPYAGRTILVSGPGVWGAVTAQVAKVVVADDQSPKGRAAQLLPLGTDLKVFVEATTGPVHLTALSAKGTVLYTVTLH